MGRELTEAKLADLLAKTSLLPVNPAWAQIQEKEKSEAKDRIVRRYEGFSFWVVAAAGLLDGINPCAFAAIIFLLSYLHIARRSPAEMLAVGAAFVRSFWAAEG